MKAKTISIPVLDQEKALEFYTEILGFQVHKDIPVGQGHRWLSLVAKEEPQGPEILLEPAPLHFQPAKTYQEALYEAGIPCTQFEVDDLEKEFQRLKKHDVNFIMKPSDVGNAMIAIFDDTCGNLLQLVEMK